MVDGNATEGRIEICLNNEWGTICDQMWNNVDAGVVCRQLHLNSQGINLYNDCIKNTVVEIKINAVLLTLSVHAAREGYSSRPVCLSVCLSVCLFVCLSVCLSRSDFGDY